MNFILQCWRREWQHSGNFLKVSIGLFFALDIFITPPVYVRCFTSSGRCDRTVEGGLLQRLPALSQAAVRGSPPPFSVTQAIFHCRLFSVSLSPPPSLSHTLLTPTSTFRCTILYFFIPESFYNVTFNFGVKRCHSWFRHCATNRRVAGSIPIGFFGIFHSHNPSGLTVTLWSTQPLRVSEIFPGGGGGRGVKAAGV